MLLSVSITQQTRLAGFVFLTASNSARPSSLFDRVLGERFYAFGAGLGFFARRQGQRLQIGILFAFAGRIVFGGSKPHPSPNDFSAFAAEFTFFCHIYYILTPVLAALVILKTVTG